MHHVCHIIWLLYNSFKWRDRSNRYTHIKITSGKGYFIDTINSGGDNLYTADQICRKGGVFDLSLLLSLEDVFFIRSLGFQWERIVPPC